MLRSGDVIRVKLFLGEGNGGHLKLKKSSDNYVFAEHRAVVMKELLSTQPLLHCCISEPHNDKTITERNTHPSDPPTDTPKSSPEGRLEIAQYLLDMKANPINLSITDDNGRTALHLAAKKEDSSMIKLLLSSREGNSERKLQLDINARCGKSGWTPLHYAAGQGDLVSVRLLMEAGASLSVYAGTGKGAAPLEVVKTRLQNAGHFSASHIANLQLVAKELSEALRVLESVRAQKEAERIVKDEQLEVTRKKLAEREDKERELLERKQKQLKDKQDRDRVRITEEENNKKPLKKEKVVSSSGLHPSQPSSSPGKGGAPTPSVQSSAVTSAVRAAAAAPSHSSPVVSKNTGTGGNNGNSDSSNTDTSKTSKKKVKKDKKEEIPTPYIAVTSVSSAVTAVVVASRDELVDHLLAMGFPEADCLSAISLYGKDLDRALSWLCDRPATPVNGSSSSSHSGNNSGGKALKGTESAKSVGPSSVSSAYNLELLKTQKEALHKEESRRINRAWNLKAEEEKRRVRLRILIYQTSLSSHF